MPVGSSFSAAYPKFNARNSILSNNRYIILLDEQFQTEVDIIR